MAINKLVINSSITDDMVETVNGLVDANDAVSNKISGSKRLALMGTSLMEQQTSSVGYANNGSISIALARLGWPFDFQPSDNFAVFGTTIDLIVQNQLPALVASHETDPISIVCVSAGGNDTRIATPIADVTAGIDTIIDTLKILGITVIFEMLNPFGKDTDTANESAKRKALYINNHLKNRYLNGDIELVDNTKVLLDTTSVYGNAIESLTYDSSTSNLHPNSRGAYLLSAKWVEVLSKHSSYKKEVSINPVDFYDGVNNPYGNVLTNTPLSGTGANPDSFSSSGGWANDPVVNSSGQNINSWKLDLSADLTGHLYDDYLGGAGWQQSDRIAEGDVIEFYIKVRLENCVGIKSLEGRIVENDGSAATTRYSNAVTTSDILTPQFDGESVELVLKTPKLTVRPYSGSGSVNFFTRLNIACDSVSSGSIRVEGWTVNKV
tara:strand:- start:363 stop:1676 length:1314 start_codon:yes stop_codon:yes gene_type:complete